MSDIRTWLNAHIAIPGGGVPVAERPVALERSRDAFRQLCTLLGDPQTSFPSILIGGTVGKTTTTLLTSTLLGATGLSVGTYTSPHLVSPTERIRWNGDPIGDAAFDEQLRQIATVETFLDAPVSWFEVLTAAALQYFSEIAVNVGVIEVGLGGAWDATTIVAPEVVTLTNIGIDHTEYFGATRPEIADAESGIITPNARVVCGEPDPDLVARMRSREHASWWQFGVDFDVRSDELAVGGRMVHVTTPEGDYPELYLGLHGRHQARDAAIALATAEAFLGAPLDREVVEAVFATARIDGRVEVAGHQPLVILDGAHNVPGALALGEALNETFAEGRRRWVIGLLKGKDPDEIFNALGIEDEDIIYATRADTPRAHDAGTVAMAARAAGCDEVHVVENPVLAAKRAIADAAPEDLVIVTGSLYLLGAVRPALVSGPV